MPGQFEDAVRVVEGLSGGERAQLLRVLLLDAPSFSPGIESTADVCGGEPCIVRTRIPVWVLEQYRRQGLSEAELLSSFPVLRAEDLVNAWAYVRSHTAEIDAHIRDNEDA